ncbi:MAG: hypothetical protein JRD68_07015 [Deltaproteobacteria bacterium]|nr:hypothetical protein [Deltaproteobacteria bacterium]
MTKYRKILPPVEAVQFNYVDGDCDSDGTVALAADLFLTRNGPSKLWELRTRKGWRIIYSGDWIVTSIDGDKEIVGNDHFGERYEPEKVHFNVTKTEVSNS